MELQVVQGEYERARAIQDEEVRRMKREDDGMVEVRSVQELVDDDAPEISQYQLPPH